MQKIPLAVAVLLLLTLPALAHAQGNSAIDQYTEGVPNASGDSLDTSGASGGAGGSPPAGTPSEAGSEGQAPADSPESAPAASPESAPAGQNGGATGGDGGGAARATGEDAGTGGGDATPASGEATPTTDIGGATAEPAADSDSGGIGALPIILGITLLAAVGYAVYEWMRRRPSRTISNPSA